jgi:hypothetical protein
VQRPHGGNEMEGTVGMLPAPEQQLGAAGDQSHALASRTKPTCQRQMGRIEPT